MNAAAAVAVVRRSCLSTVVSRDCSCPCVSTVVCLRVPGTRSLRGSTYPLLFYTGFLTLKFQAHQNKFPSVGQRLKVCYAVVLVSLRLSIALVNVNAVFSGSGECNLVPRLTCCETEIWLTLRVIQPGMHVSFNHRNINHRYYITRSLVFT